MKSVALITEYNPFHNGHERHAIQSKFKTQSDVTIAIMSGHFVMRGEPAIFNKFTRAKMALSTVDLVVELPLIGALSSSEIFAEMGVKVADYMGCEHLSFGSESGDLEDFSRGMQALNQIEQSDQFKAEIKKGKSYARIVSELLDNPDIVTHPNNILGLSYMKAISRFAPHISPHTIKRTGANHHDENLTSSSKLASGSAIRKALSKHEDISPFVPKEVRALYQTQTLTWDDCFPYLKYQIEAQSSDALKQIYTMSEGLENRLKSTIHDSDAFESFMNGLKTKRYTHTHLQRVLTNVLLNFKYEDVKRDVQGVRILAMNDTGRAYLKHLKATYPDRNFETNTNKKNQALFQHEIKATRIYNLISGQRDTDFNTPVIRT
ncbi:nucleotidyltransferase [Staphylococcus massiliensis]|uniref:tRNA(Met) cytidine acetate ligase n=1 Tax=Staphylococcus massiliensis S46 TaxID=1229783 RepID=K9AXD3_9STAP|nr:nucleotidyltransferase [Staphylococcus massiliensis]EKU46190.1 hypothetical protein C273_09774 [Staphylococcus massiliensis S46]MCG3401456.1 nucleotidyltransferase [Staphylococcus massiliensis]MCG3411760.1 nucleotidyltransferase [Staphylococcus massiliensis]PNZ99521.1 nucleotidyltransferase [Staphylococcus massiliensis CCUG 55927]